MSTVLLTARCAAGHTWDLWADEPVEEGGRYRAPFEDLRCPSCEPAAFAIDVEPAEGLA